MFQSASFAAEAPCRAEPLRLRVRFAGEAPRDALLESLQPSGLRLLDSQSREQIWSGGPGPATTQQIAGMDSSIGASLVAVHLDTDGIHDRIYAGDRSGRLWRLELRTGAKKTSWVEATMLADLGVTGGGRGFVAKPDVSRIEAPSGAWLNIAIGTANTGEPRNDHRFYVLRDSMAAGPGNPLVETDLELLLPPAGISRGNSRGYYLALGSAQVLAQALTLNGRIHFTAVESARNLLTACASNALPAMDAPLSVTVLRAKDGELESEYSGDGNAGSSSLRRPLAGSWPATTGVELATSVDATGHVPCVIGVETLPGCFLDTRPKRSWWRREDAD
ncbi:MAG: hypothetical protein ABI645_17485 [Pseudomonadota bacterium]